MSFPRYAKYKASGVEWLGDVPEHWEVCAIKRLIQKIESGTSVNASDEPAVNGKIGVLKTSCVYTGIFDPKENKTVVDEETDRVSCPLKVGTLIVSRMNTPDLIGAAGLVTQSRDNLFLPDRLWQVSFLNTDPSYVYYWTLTSLYRGQVKAVCTGTSSSMKNLGQDQFGNFSFASPPYAEQVAIAAFLDWETAKIDGLVAEQKRLMELLKEKRQAVISHAVTKGLNPNAKMKPSGVEWLGDVPAGWEVRRLKRFCHVFPSNIDKKTYDGETPVKLCNYTDVYYNDTITSNMELMDATASTEQIAKFTLRAGDTIITKDSETANDIAIGAYVPVDLPGVVCGYHLSVIRPMPETNGAFIKRLFDSIYVKGCVEVRANGLTRVGLGQYEIDNLDLPFPPLAEQTAIAAFLDRETAKFDTLTAEAQLAIDLLQERRTALIAAAVTGQIDVRKMTTKETK